MRFLLATTGAGAIAAVLAATPALAETVISTAVTTPVLTGTTNDDVRISSTGSVKPTSGAAVTINSNDSVKNEGTIQITGSNNSTGILANTNLTGNITNTGTITIDENYTPTDTDSDGDLDGPFAQGSGRYGIHVLGGGTFTGNILNSGTITVEGNQSAGIAVDSTLAGSLSMTGGAINILGDNSYGILAGDVTGNVSLTAGTIAVQGANSVGVALTGDIGGALVIQNTVASTGYRSTTAPADTSKLDADDLLQGGSAVVVGGNVAGGILFDAPPPDNSTTDTDEDDDGVVDANEATASITTYGSAPAVRIGSATEDTTIGAVASSTAGHGLVIKGKIQGNGVYNGVDGNGLVIGGQGHAVTVAGGMTNSGTIAATAVKANATGLRIGAGGSVPTIVNSGAITAIGGGTDTTSAQALVIESGATVTTIKNSGSILAKVNDTALANTAAAIVDKSGTLTLIENSGAIGVTDSSTLGAKAVAFDLSANTTGTTVKQLVAATGKAAPTIAGTMLFGTGNDVLDVADGTVTGDAKFGIGNNTLSVYGDAAMVGATTFGAGNDIVQLAGTGSLTGNIDFGGGTDILLLNGASKYSGQLSNSTGLNVGVGGGATLDVTNLGAVNLASLNVADGGTIGVTIDSVTNTNTLYNIAGSATFGANTKIAVTLASVGDVDGTYKIIDAGTLTGASNLSSSVGSFPFLFNSSLDTSTAGEVSVTVNVKTAEELGLNDSESSILGAVLGSADSDVPIAKVLLAVDDSDTLRSTLQQMLPEHAGGAFETATKGSRLAAQILSDPRAPVVDRGDLGLWLQQVGWGNSKSIGSTSSYDLTGWGAVGGVERKVGGLGALGLSLGYYAGKDSHGNNELMSNQYEGSAYWRGRFGPINAFARASASMINFDGTRNFTGTVGTATVTRTAEGDWKGRMYSAIGGASYEARMGRLSLRPSASLEYLKLTEKGFTETGGGDAFNLTVRSRQSDETAATAMLTVGYDIMGLKDDEAWMRAEVEFGRRQILSGSLGKTVAWFKDGQPFTLTAEERTSGWVAGGRIAGGGPRIAIAAEGTAEEQQGEASIGARLGVQLSL